MSLFNHKRKSRIIDGVGQPPMIVRDCYGRPLNVGDDVIFPGITAPRAIVSEIRPDLTPGSPPNTMIVVFQTTIVMKSGADQPIGQIARLRTAIEAGRLPEPPVETPEDKPTILKLDT